MSSVAQKNLRPPLFVDNLLVSAVVLLVGISLVMIYSTTAIVSQEHFGDAFYYVKRQGAAALVGLILMLLCSRLDIELLRRISPVLLPIALFLLVLIQIPGLGDAAGGAKRWVNLGFMRFQPGEFCKLLFVIFMAGYLARQERTIHTFVDGIIKPIALVTLAAALFLAQPDFGSTVIVFSVVLCMMAVSGVRLIYLGAGAGLIVLALASLVVISPYRLKRIVSFLSPWSDPSGKGYQLIQSLIAIGTGQLFGVGLGESKQKLFYLPAAHTDFIFSMVAEELGFIGGAALVLLFLVVLWRGLALSKLVIEDTFAFSLAVGLTMLIVAPALLNIGVVTGLLPTKGMVLPLVGYGGSSLIASLVALGLLLAIGRSVQRSGIVARASVPGALLDARSR
ncbi:MAG: putative lipid II flippase FtsW [Oligoflexia bacterium]|nr:putative lipid II flippase FtsW [Oligoflexia bacterium]